MAKYTTQVKSLVEMATINYPDKTIYEKVALACPTIFNFDFPIWDEDYRLILEQKIINHYFMKEIGMETVGLWKFYLSERLNLIMPLYNQMYQVTNEQFNFLTDIDLTEEYTDNKNSQDETNRTIDETGKDTTNGTITNEGNGTRTNDITRTNNETVNNEGSGNSTDKLTGSVNTTTDTTSTFDGSVKLNANGTENTTLDGKELSSDYPQANTAGVDYGTNLTETDNTTNTTRTQNDTTTTDNTTQTDQTVNQTTNNTDTLTNTYTDDTTRKGDSTENIDEKTTNNNTTTSNNTINRSKNTSDNYTGTLNSTFDYVRKKTGLSGGKTYTQLMLEYRDSLINIDNLIINELRDLFMMIY